MEYGLAGEICGVVDASISAIQKVLFGSGLLTPAIQNAASSLLAGTVPSEWKKAWEGCLGCYSILSSSLLSILLD